MKIKNIVLATSLASLVVMSSWANAHGDEQQRMDTKPQISIEKAMKIAAPGNRETITAAESKHYKDQPVYTVLVESENQVSEKLINGLTGKIMGEISVRGANAEITEFLEEGVFSHHIDLNEQHGEDEGASHH